MKAPLRIAVGAVLLAIALASTRARRPPRAAPAASCPRVTGQEATGRSAPVAVLAGSMFPWAAREDRVAVGRLGDVDGEYRVRIDASGASTARIDRVELLVLDHEPGVDPVAGEDGEIVAIARAAEPSVLPLDRDVLEGGMREAWTVTTDAVEARAAIVLTASMTPFAEDAFARYLARMGQGMGPFMRWVTGEDCSAACRREVMDDETVRLGIPLAVTATVGGEAARTWSVRAIGPGAGRRVALPLDLPTNGARVKIRLEGTRRFWRIDDVALARRAEATLDPVPMSPSAAALTSPAGPPVEVTRRVRSGDRDRVAFASPSFLDVRFRASPVVQGRARAAFVAVTGHYDAPIGGGPWIDACAVLSHRAGWASLPRFAAGLP